MYFSSSLRQEKVLKGIAMLGRSSGRCFFFILG